MKLVSLAALLFLKTFTNIISESGNELLPAWTMARIRGDTSMLFYKGDGKTMNASTLTSNYFY